MVPSIATRRFINQPPKLLDCQPVTGGDLRKKVSNSDIVGIASVDSAFQSTALDTAGGRAGLGNARRYPRDSS